MEKQGESVSSNYNQNRGSINDEEELISELRRGPWTADEDFTLINYIAHHGEGRWNSLARCAGLKRTGKSCRLRWLNYLRPDVRRGNITLEEQLLILELHSRWGNKWSKIAQHLPGRTDNEIKNYWRTRVHKHAKQLKCDVNSKQFKDTMRFLWMPRLVERIQATAAGNPTPPVVSSPATITTHHFKNNNFDNNNQNIMMPHQPNIGGGGIHKYTPENPSAAASSDCFGGTPASDLTECYNKYTIKQGNNQDYYNQYTDSDHQSLSSRAGYFDQGTLDFMEQNSQYWMDGGDVSDSLWNVDDIWFLQQQFNSHV